MSSAFVLFSVIGGLIGGVVGHRDWSARARAHSPWTGSRLRAIAVGAFVGAAAGFGAAFLMNMLNAVGF